MSEKDNKVRIQGNKDRSVFMDATSEHIEFKAGKATGSMSDTQINFVMDKKNTLEEKDTDEAHKRIMIPTGQQVILSKSLEKVMLLGNKERTVFIDVVKDHIRLVADEAEALFQKDGISFHVGNSNIIMGNENNNEFINALHQFKIDEDIDNVLVKLTRVS